MDYKKACTVSNILFVSSIPLILAAIYFSDDAFQWASWLIGAILFFAGMVISVKYYRCPHCGIHLGRMPVSKNVISPFCPHCGSRLGK